MEGKLGKQSHAEEGKLQGQPNNAFASFTSPGVKREQKSCPEEDHNDLCVAILFTDWLNPAQGSQI